MQRRRLLVDTPLQRLRAAARMVELAATYGSTIAGARVFEVGTGHRVNVPIGLWLCGASEITTVDLRPILRNELINNDLLWIRNHRAEVQGCFAACADQYVFHDRLEQIASIPDAAALLDKGIVRYLAPQDASNLPTDFKGKFDFHVSYTVLEHIPPNSVVSILAEGRRVLSSGGLFIHCWDHSDHFAHADGSISSINHLAFTDEQWHRLAGNPYAYTNRLRTDDAAAIFMRAGIFLVDTIGAIDSKALAALSDGFQTDRQFAAKPAEVICTSNTWFIGR